MQACSGPVSSKSSFHATQQHCTICGAHMRHRGVVPGRRHTCMGLSRLAAATSGAEMSRDMRARMWLGFARNASSASPSGAFSVSDWQSRRICTQGMRNEQ